MSKTITKAIFKSGDCRYGTAAAAPLVLGEVKPYQVSPTICNFNRFKQWQNGLKSGINTAITSSPSLSHLEQNLHLNDMFCSLFFVLDLLYLCEWKNCFYMCICFFGVSVSCHYRCICEWYFCIWFFVVYLCDCIRGNQMGNYRGCSNISNVFVEVMADIYFIFHINMLTQWLTALPIQLVPQCLKFCNLRSRVNNVHILTGQYFLVKLYLFTTKLIYLGYSYHPYLAICVRSTR